MKKILILAILFFVAPRLWAISPCLDVNPTLTTTEVSTGNYEFDVDYTAFSTYTLVGLEWDFDDGTIVTNSSQYMTHQYYYSSSQTYNIEVICQFDYGDGTFFYCTLYDTISVTGSGPEPGCPVATFTAIKLSDWCPTGELILQWAFCHEDYDGDGIGDNYWTPDYVDWDFGDGYTGTSLGTSYVTHNFQTYQQVYITAVAHFTGQNGEECSVTLMDLPNTSSDPCLLVNDPTMTHTPYFPVTPYAASAEVYVQSTSGTYCSGYLLSFYNFGQFYENGQVSSTPTSTTNWSYQLNIDGQSVASGSGMPDNSSPIYQNSFYAGDYSVEIIYSYVYGSDSCSTSYNMLLTVDSCETACDSCNSFKPYAGERYWLSAWVKEDQASQVLSYDNAYITIGFNGGASSVDFYPEGDIIEGWQRIVGSFTIPAGSTELSIDLVNDNTTIPAYFDDIRINPYNSNMKSYVYDPETFWLTAELDDNNYATFYEYDKQGILMRIKKETERGIMTIQESRSNNPKSE